MPKLVQGVTILEVKDIKRGEAFYREQPGFRPGLFFGEPPTFEQRQCRDFSRSGANTPPAPLDQYWAVYFYVDDVNAMAAELAARGVAIDREPDDQPYGCRDFDIRDPDGHAVGIGQNEKSMAGQLTLPYGD